MMERDDHTDIVAAIKLAKHSLGEWPKYLACGPADAEEVFTQVRAGLVLDDRPRILVYPHIAPGDMYMLREKLEASDGERFGNYYEYPGQ